MPYDKFTDYPLWKEASELADSIFDFSRAIEDFSIRNRLTASALEIPFRLGEAAQTDSDETMKDRLWKVEDPVNELRSILNEAKEQGFAPEADYAALQERCRSLFQKVHMEASSPNPIGQPEKSAPPEESTDPELSPIEQEPEEVVQKPKLKLAHSTKREDKGDQKPEPKSTSTPGDSEFDENMLI